MTDLPDEDQVIQLDAYLDHLLAGSEARPVDVERVGGLDAGLLAAVRTTQRTLVRFHPSFRFEERLLRRLRHALDDAGEMVPGDLVALPLPAVAPAGVGAGERGRGLILGGAIVSGVIASGVSLAGAALLAWRRSRAASRWERLA